MPHQRKILQLKKYELTVAFIFWHLTLFLGLQVWFLIIFFCYVIYSIPKKYILFQWLVALLVLKGKVLETMDNRDQASDIFKEALKLDPYCQEALHYLTKHQMLSAEQEKSLLDSIPLG